MRDQYYESDEEFQLVQHWQKYEDHRGFHGVVMGQLHYLRMVSVFVWVTLL
jgi:hypothetical protein